jgi:hypothetical protein
MSLVQRLSGLGACREALEWVEAGGYTDLDSAWAACPRGDWCLWLHGRVTPSAPWSDERKPLVAAAVACARLALPVYAARYPGSDRVRRCLDVTEAWCRGEATAGEVREARRGAYADAAAAAYAFDAAAAAADADAAAFAAAFAAADAAFAAAAAAAAERARVLRECADIARAMLPCPVLP